MLLPIILSVFVTGCSAFYLEWKDRRVVRKTMYERAVARSLETGKPLLVIGDPSGGVTHGDYGYGDACVDMTGCPNAPPGAGQRVVLGEEPLPFEDDSHVVFVCYVLELVPNVDHAISEIERVGGRSEDVFALALQDDEMAQAVYPGTLWNFKELPQGQVAGEFVYEPIERRQLVRARVRGR